MSSEITIRPEVLGPRLKAARSMARLTQETAANELGMARTTLLAIEAGKRAVRSEELRSLVELYGIRESELLSGYRQPLDMEVKYRCIGSSSGITAATAEVAALLSRLAAASVELEEMLGYPESPVDYPQLHLSRDESLEQQSEDAALSLRQRLGIGLGPIPDLTSLLEMELGLRVFERPLPAKVSGAFAFHAGHGGFVLLNSNHPQVRRRLTAAHEVGHFLSKRIEPVVVLETDSFSEREDKFCDMFARALLMPAVTVRRKASELRGMSKDFTIRHMLWMAGYFHVSIEAMARRLEALGLVPKGTYDSLKERGLGRRHLEHVLKASDLPRETPQFTPRLLLLAGEAYARGLLSEQQIAERLELDLLTVRRVLEEVVGPEEHELERAG
jgi:Zn-dependent peptidase ImmA (M78 family)/DNA-binding XRE family transcriptional regulator